MEWLNENRSENVFYTYPEYAMYLEILSTEECPGGPETLHWHDDVEFIVGLGGECTEVVNGETVKFSSGEGIFINARQMHYGVNPTPAHALCVRVNPRILCMSPLFENTYVLPVLQNNRMPYLKLTVDAEWQSKILQILTAMHRLRDEAGAHLRLQGLFCLLWSEIYANMPENVCLPKSRTSDLAAMEAMIEFIEQHSAEKLTLEKIAEAGLVCESKCCRLFGKYLHKTPNAYLTDYRLGKAAQLLTSTEQSVTEIALTCGFGGASYFAETFRKHHGCSPKEYRKDGAIRKKST